jgi:pimeloyl-ACP methyl ester carboxylesterase
MQLCGAWRLYTIPLIANGIGLETDGYIMDSKPTLVMVPCFAGALVGDSFGAVISIAAAVRQPKGSIGLVLSGGFARNPITSPVLKALAALAPFFPGPFYRQLTLRMHANNLKSRFDREGEIPWSAEKTRHFFVQETPHRAYVNWVHAVGRANYAARLSRISVPTLILTPKNDRLIGKDAARILLGGIRRSRELVLARTGHMFRFSHSGRYSEAVSTFLTSAIPTVGDAR